MTVERIRVQSLRSWAGAVAVVAAVVVMMSATTSWACSPTASVSGIYPEAGGSGSEVTVTGKYMTPVVEIRWGTVTGPLLAKVSGPSFSARVQIPQADPGYYYVVALGRAADGSIAGKASATFQVTGPEPATDTAPTSPAPADSVPAGPAQTSTGSSAPSDPTAATTPTVTASAPTSQSQPNPQSAVSPLPASSAAVLPPSPVASNGAPGSKVSSTIATAVTARTNSAAGGQTQTGTAPVVPSQPSTASPAPVVGGAPENPEPVVSQVAPTKPAWQDTPEGDFGLLNVDRVRPSRAPAAGFGVALTVGTAALFGGFAFVAVIRRRQLARSTSR